MPATLTESNISNFTRTRCFDPWNALELQRGIISKQNLRRVLNGSPASIDKLLDEHLAVNPIGLLAEHCAENDGDSIVAGFDIDSLLLAIMNSLHFSTLAHTLRSIFRAKLRSLFFQLVVLLVCLLERCSHRIALEECELEGKGVTLL